jgi:hypothetical protein
MSIAPHDFKVAQITGSADVCLILGDPVEQVLGPEIFNPLFDLVINASPLGLKPSDPPPWDLSQSDVQAKIPFVSVPVPIY